ncbi:YcaO-like family protein [Streptosporangium sandarakinum]|uniref:YcaO-like family protein n=1 Tax=Streptosporangium sandarakinum TaxID=1260955 RepID=UPI00343EF91C
MSATAPETTGTTAPEAMNTAGTETTGATAPEVTGAAGPEAAPAAEPLGALAELDRLMGPYGLASRVRRLPNHPGEPRFAIFTASMGDLTAVSPNIAESAAGSDIRGGMDGAGGGLGTERAGRLCVAESLERYSSCVFDEAALRWATAEELGDEALDLGTVPRCSPRELAHPKSIVTAPDPAGPMRWTRGWSLTGNRPVWVPAVMVWMHIRAKSAAERLTMPISTGCAAHSDLASALVGAICEVVERDAIALTWLQRIPWPRIELDEIPGRLAPYVERHRAGHVRTHFYDATTDLGVPTVYSIDLTPDNEVLGQLVMCNTDLDPAVSIGKIMRESASSRIAMQVPRPRPADPDEFLHVFHGASYMGAPERAGDFAFLLDGRERRPLSAMPDLSTGTAAGDLRLLVERLGAAGCDVIAVEITTDEARDVGFRVVRVIIPQLMPLSFVHTARYTAHPRLYEAPARMGYRVHAEADLNPLPQPFA